MCLKCAKEWISSLESVAKYKPHEGSVNPEIRMNDVLALLERLGHCGGEPILLPNALENKVR